MLSGKSYIFPFISESHWTILKALVYDSPCRLEEAFEFLTSLVLLGRGTLLTMISKIADSYSIATDAESIITTAG